MRTLSLPALLLAVAGCSSPSSITNDTGAAPVASENAAAPETASTPAAPENVVEDEDRQDGMPGNVAAAVDPAGYSGRWRGVEGMYLVVSPQAGADVSLEMQWDLDHRGTFPGVVTAEGIRFTRDGRSELLRRTDGDATGLKYLAGEKDCLTVRSGEGYCRR